MIFAVKYNMKERLQKFIAQCQVASRRKAEEIILLGRVSVNGVVTTTFMGIDPEVDIVEIDGKRLKPPSEKLYIMFNKPEGVVTTLKDEHGRKCIPDVVNVGERVFPIGRLDSDTSGLLLLTNDGEIANEIMHPSREIDKTYEALVEGIPDSDDIRKFNEGFIVEDYKTAPATLKIIKTYEKTSLVRVVIHEGKKRQARRMLMTIKHPAISLKRTKIGAMSLGDLKIGQWRIIPRQDIERLILKKNRL